MRLAVILFALAFAGCAGAPDAPPAPTVAAPEWSFVGLDGATYSRDSPERNATILFFMASWCSSCKAKAPLIAEVAADFAPRGVATYSLDFDPSETAADLRGWMDRYHQEWPHGLDPSLNVQRAFGVRSQSSVVVLDAQGVVVQSWGYGQVSDAPLRAAIERALSGA